MYPISKFCKVHSSVPASLKVGKLRTCLDHNVFIFANYNNDPRNFDEIIKKEMGEGSKIGNKICYQPNAPTNKNIMAFNSKKATRNTKNTNLNDSSSISPIGNDNNRNGNQSGSNGGMLNKKRIADAFLTGSAVYLEQMYDEWLKEPSTVHSSWHAYFKSLHSVQPPNKQIKSQPILTTQPTKTEIELLPLNPIKASKEKANFTDRPHKSNPRLDRIAVEEVIRSYLALGHTEAKLDPLEMLEPDYSPTSNKILTQPKLALHESVENMSFKEVIEKMQHTYCRHIGIEFSFIRNAEETKWLREQMESEAAFPKDLQLQTWRALGQACGLERYFEKKFPSEKRFGLEGCEVLIPVLHRISEVTSMLGVENIVLAMAHRGRLNVITNVCAHPLRHTLTHFHGYSPSDEGSGDVKYHLGVHSKASNERSKKTINYIVVANPSHLEIVSTVALGKCRCMQDLDLDVAGQKSMTIIIHGDAAFSGEGVCYECINMSRLPSFSTQGTIHIVVNNQIGFTTDPLLGRSSPYCTDLGRVVQAPILHVNADDPESAIKVATIAAQWRQNFHKDVIVDLVGYRRYGHNEQDNPQFTQPLMYAKIKAKPNVYEIYSNTLVQGKVITQGEAKELVVHYEHAFDAEFKESKKVKAIDYSLWTDTAFFEDSSKGKVAMPQTGIAESVIQTIAKKFSSPPPADFNVHPGISRILKGREQMMHAQTADWAVGEALAYASLLREGIPVRLSGQDSQRGTFGHRHNILHDQKRDKVVYNMLENIFPKQAAYRICNSPLNEMGVLGFEMGYASHNHHGLVIWEAQFGDFFNMAQAMFDNFLSSQETKWRRQCGLVCKLPHGLEGMGPEHSSCRVERFLQMATDPVEHRDVYDEQFVFAQHQQINWFVACCSTPASMFHILRRQMYLPFRKPLILLTPKSYLRLPAARSPFSGFREGTAFQRLIPHQVAEGQEPSNVKRLIFCFGKTYYDIMSCVAEAKLQNHVAVARVEQLAPFPYDLVAQEVHKYPKAELVWAQEEHENQGAWSFVKERIIAAAGGKREIRYVGRGMDASPATGNIVRHREECEKYKQEIIRLN